MRRPPRRGGAPRACARAVGDGVARAGRAGARRRLGSRGRERAEISGPECGQKDASARMRHACAPEGRPAPRSRCGTHPLVAAEWWVYLVEIGICKGGQSRRCVQHLLGKRCHARGQHSRTAERRCVHRGRRWKGVGAPSSPQALLSERFKPDQRKARQRGATNTLQRVPHAPRRGPQRGKIGDDVACTPRHRRHRQARFLRVSQAASERRELHTLP
jgi:hypothetical protein